MNMQHSGIMALQLNRILILNTSQILTGPDIRDLELGRLPLHSLKSSALLFFRQLRNLTPYRCASLLLALGVEHQDQSAFLEGAGPVLSRVFCVKGVVWVIPPFVRECRAPDFGVLVEGEENFVLEDGQFLVFEFVELERMSVLSAFLLAK